MNTGDRLLLGTHFNSAVDRLICYVNHISRALQMVGIHCQHCCHQQWVNTFNKLICIVEDILRMRS